MESISEKRNFNVNSIPNLLPILIIITISGIITVINPVFFTWSNISNILMQSSGTALIALGAMMVIISGGIDFTSAEIMACGSVIGGLLYLYTGNNPIFLIIGCLGIGIVVGITNGILISHFKFPPFVATLAMLSIVHGTMLLFAEGNIIQLEGKFVEFIGKGRLLGFPVAFIILFIFASIMWLIMNRTKLGTYTYALGGNVEALIVAGVDIKKYTMLIYIMAGTFSALGTILITCRMSAIYSSVSSTLLLDGIAATVIGGTSTKGGKGTVVGTIIGALIIGIIGNAITLLNVPSRMHDVVKGGIIVFALLLDVFINRDSI